MPSQYPPNWPLTDAVPTEEMLTPIAMRPRSHQPRHYVDSPYPVKSSNSQKSCYNHQNSHDDSDLQRRRSYVESPCPAGISTQSEDSWYVGNFEGDGTSMHTQNRKVENRDRNATSIISKIPTWDSNYSSSLISSSSVPDDNSLDYDFLDYYTSSDPSSGEPSKENFAGRETLNDTPSSIGAFCDQLMGSYKELDHGKKKGTRNVNVLNTDKPLPPLPSQLKRTLSMSTLSSSDFLSCGNEDKENAPTPPPAISFANTIQSNRGGSVYSPDDVPRRPDGGPGLPLPLMWDVGFEEAKRVLKEHINSRKPYIAEANFFLQSNLGLWGKEIDDLKSEMDFGPALDLSAVSGNFQDVTGGTPKKQKWGQRTKLREALLMHGKARYGHQSRTELASVSFHDLTTGEDGAFRNELLAHYDLDMEETISGGTTPKLTLYEVDVPLPVLPGRPPKFERWLHIFISLPFLTRFPSNTPPAFRTISPQGSWVTIAVPLHSVTTHDPISETLPPAKFLSRTKTYERHDFDFGPAEGDGGPDGVRKQVQFEFMDKMGRNDLFPDLYRDMEDDKVFTRLMKNIQWPTTMMKLQHQVGADVNFVAPQFPSSGYAPPSRLPIRGKQQGQGPNHSRSGSRSSKGQGLGRGIGQTMDQNQERIEQLAQEWHAEMLEKVREDGARWTRIHKAMVNGKCRLICRIEEKGIKMVLRSASKKIGKTGLSREMSP